MSDLRERLLEALAAPWGIPSGQGSDAIKRIWPIIEAELQKRDRLRDQINDAYVRTEASLNEANKQLEELRDQGCEFCEAAIDDRITDEPEFMGNFKHSWICGRCWNDQGRKLTETNKLLEQTIEVLEAADRYAQHCDRTWGVEVHIRNPYAAGHYGWQVWKAAKKAKPLLDNLKALKKEGTE